MSTGYWSWKLQPFLGFRFRSVFVVSDDTRVRVCLLGVSNTFPDPGPDHVPHAPSAAAVAARGCARVLVLQPGHHRQHESLPRRPVSLCAQAARENRTGAPQRCSAEPFGSFVSF